MPEWKILAEPEGKNPGETEEVNESAMVVKLYPPTGGTPQEVCRVGFARRHSRNPDVAFEDQLHTEMGKARAACDLLNQQLQGAGDLA